MNLKELADKFKSKLTLNSIQCKVRNVTSYEEFGPTTQDMKQIVEAMTLSPTSFNDVCYVLWKRLFDDIENDWVRVYKSLKLLHYLVLHGESRFIDEARRHTSALRVNLIHYTCLDRDGRDQGINVRSRVCEILDLLSNDETLREERLRAREIQSKVGNPVILSNDLTPHRTDRMFYLNSLRKRSSGHQYSDSPWTSKSDFTNSFSDNPPDKSPRRDQDGTTNSKLAESSSSVVEDLIGLDFFEFSPSTESKDAPKDVPKDLLIFDDFGDFVGHETTTEPEWGDFVGPKEPQKMSPVKSYDPFADIVQSFNRN